MPHFGAAEAHNARHGPRDAARIPGAKLTIIHDAGHVTNIEQPAAFNAAVISFLRAL